MINIYGSGSFDGTFEPSSAVLIATVNSGLPEGSAETYTSPPFIIKGDPCNVIWLEIMETVSGYPYYSLSEISATEYLTEIVDPEARDENRTVSEQ